MPIEWHWEEIENAAHDVTVLLHELRTQALRTLEYAGPTLLSAGAAGRWYFDWIAANYRGEILRHYGVDAYAAKPASLPENAVWIASHVDRLDAIPNESVHLVIAGQLIEHLWADELAAFLHEAWRVLRPGGRILVDSPNRAVALHLRWRHPEHTVELSDSEAVRMARLSGFDTRSLNGLWRCVDADCGAPLPFEPDGDVRKRVASAWEHPDESFIWWLVAEKAERPPAGSELLTFLRTLHAAQLPGIRARFSSDAGRIESENGRNVVKVAHGEACSALYGPSIPLPAGRHTAEFLLRGDGPAGRSPQVVAELDVVIDDESAVRRCITTEDLVIGRWCRVEIAFGSASAMFGVQRRIRTTGTMAVTIDADQSRIRVGDPSVPTKGPAAGRAPARRMDERVIGALRTSEAGAILRSVRRRLHRARGGLTGKGGG